MNSLALPIRQRICYTLYVKHAPQRGRPTNDPKTQLVAVRLPIRHLRLVERRAKSDDVTFSEALRRFLEEAMKRHPR